MTMTKADKIAAQETANAVAIRERMTVEGTDVVQVAAEIMEAEQAIGQASATLSARLMGSTLVAATCHHTRGEASKIAKAVVVAEAGKGRKVTLDAAKQAVGRMVKVGRILMAHPTMDPLEAYTLANRATVEQVDNAVAAADDEKATAALAKVKREKSDTPAKEKNAGTLATARVNALASDRAWLTEHATRDEVRAYYNSVAAEIVALASDLKSDAIKYRDEISAEQDAEQDAADVA